MKKLFLLVAFLLVATPMFATQVSFKTGDGTDARLLFNMPNTNFNITAGLNYQELHANLDVNGDETGLSGSALMPSIGVEYILDGAKNVETVFGLEYQHFFPSLSVKNDSYITDQVKEILDNTTMNCISLYTGVNVKITPELSLTGTTGIRFLNATYDKDDVNLNLGVNSMYTKIGFLATL